MATRVQKDFFITVHDLRGNYQKRVDVIKQLCKLIAVSTQTTISSHVMPNGTVKFVIIGSKGLASTSKAKHLIVGQFCKKNTHLEKPMRSSQEAMQLLGENKQMELLKENRYLLTEAAVKKLNPMTGASELREFACAPCDRFWWQVVPITKPVSRCIQCKLRYDALPRDKEFGIGRFLCTECEHSFNKWCTATSVVHCTNCKSQVRAPYIHPKLLPRDKPKTPQVEPVPPKPNVPQYVPQIFAPPVPLQATASSVHYELKPPPRTLSSKPKRVINGSTVHAYESTGFTISTILTQDETMIFSDSDEDYPSTSELDESSDEAMQDSCQKLPSSRRSSFSGSYASAVKDSTQSSSLFDEAMRKGCVTLELLKMLISGVAGAGKTSTLYMLLGQKPPEIRQSTPCACRPVHVIPILSDSKSAIWHILEDSGLKTLLAELVNVYEDIENEDKPDPDSHTSAIEPVPTMLKEDTTKSEPTKTTSQPHPLTKAKPRTSQEAPNDANELEDSSSTDRVEELEEANSNIPNHLLKSSATEDELVKLIDQSDGKAIHLKKRWISITDTGGQPQFRAVLPVFLRQTSLFIHVQKLSEALSDKPVIEYYDDQGKPLSKPIKSPLTNEEHVKCAVRSVQSLRFTTNEVKPPKMLFIATHKDEEHKSSEKREVKEKKMLELVSPISSRNGVIYCGSRMKNVLFGVNAKDPGAEEKKMVKAIRNIINELFPPARKKIPLRWFVLQLKLQEIAKVLGRLVITKQECLQAAQRIHLNSEEALDAALKYLDELNIILYYPKILPDLVFCNIQVIIDKLTELVEHLYKLMKDPDECSAYTGDWKMFREFGLITENILKHDDFQSHYFPGIFTFHHLIKLFRSLLVIADFQRDNQEKEEYFMPCLLHTIETEKVAKRKADSKPAVPSLVLHFPDGLLNGVFCFTIASLLSSENTTHKPWKLKLRDGSPECLYRNIVQFTIPIYPGIITLIDWFDFVEVVVGSCPEKFCKAFCPLVKKAILQSLAKATELLNYTPCEPEEAVLCPCEDPNPHHAEVIELEGEKLWKCSKDEANCGELGEMYDVWNDKKTPERMKIASQFLTAPAVCRAIDQVIDWHSLGMFLGIKKMKLDVIKIDYDKYGLVRQRSEMIHLWLQSDCDASWNKLCEALDNMNEENLASQIRSYTLC